MAGQLPSGADGELGVDPGEVVLDGLDAEVELGGVSRLELPAATRWAIAYSSALSSNGSANPPVGPGSGNTRPLVVAAA
jgi:hypothetical protein